MYPTDPAYGIVTPAGTPHELARFMRSEIELWRKIIGAAGIQPS